MITGLILAGGQNRRMGGERKLFLRYGGQTFWERIHCALSALPEVFLSVEEETAYLKTGLPLVVDRYPGAGPMGGICSGMEVCKGEALFVTPCDTPLLDAETVGRLVMTYEASGVLTLAQTNGRLQPLLGVYPKSLHPVMVELIRKKAYKVSGVLPFTDYMVVPLDPGSCAADNINTREEYQTLLRCGEL